MPRIRTVKPDFFADEDLSALPPEVHLMAAALLPYSDDEGFFKANNALVKAHCCPLREDSLSVHGALSELARIGFIRLGTGPDGKRYGHVRTFAEHQRVNRPTPSKIATLPIVWDDSLRTHPQLTEDSPQEGKGREGKGRKGKDTAPSSASSLPAAGDEVFITLPLNDKSEHPVSVTDVARWQALYPAVDVEQQLRNMRGWLESNPDKRKTKNGVKRFITNWLAREQNQGGSGKSPRTAQNAAQPAPQSHREPQQPGNGIIDDNAREGMKRFVDLGNSVLGTEPKK